MSLKRRIAKAKIGLRHRQDIRAEKKARKLALQRNKFARQAERAANEAQLLEQRRQAELKLMSSKAKVKAVKEKSRKKRNHQYEASMRKAAKSTVKGLKTLQGWARKTNVGKSVR